MRPGKLIIAIVVAAALWFIMFSPWTRFALSFWVEMSISALILISLVVLLSPKGDGVFKFTIPGRGVLEDRNDTKTDCTGNTFDRLFCGRSCLLKQLLLGVGLALLLWGVFYVGDKLSSLLFDFARPQVDSVYAMKGGFPYWAIALLLLLVIGPAEELFWRGFVQKNMVHILLARYGRGTSVAKEPNRANAVAFAVTTVIYALVHIWSFNFMLVMAAMVAGAFWGLLYMINPRMLPALVVSHALWDALVFVIFPI